MLHALPWESQVHLLGARFGDRFTGGRGLRTKWRHVREEPDAPVALNALALTTGTLLTVLTLALGGTRLVSGLIGWRQWGMEPWGPPWLALGVISIVFAAAIALVKGVGTQVTALAVMAALACFAHLLWLTLASGRDLFGWPVTLLVVGPLALVTAAAAIRASLIANKINNPLRAALAAAE